MGFTTEIYYTLFGLGAGILGPSIYIHAGFAYLYLQIFLTFTSLDKFLKNYSDFSMVDLKELCSLSTKHFYILFLFSILYFFIRTLKKSGSENLPVYSILAFFSFITTFLGINTIEKSIKHCLNINSAYNSSLWISVANTLTSYFDNIKTFYTSSIYAMPFIFFCILMFLRYRSISLSKYSVYINMIYSVVVGAGLAVTVIQISSCGINYQSLFFYNTLIVLGFLTGYNLVKNTSLYKYLYSEKLYIKAFNRVHFIALCLVLGPIVNELMDFCELIIKHISLYIKSLI